MVQKIEAALRSRVSADIEPVGISSSDDDKDKKTYSSGVSDGKKVGCNLC